MKFNRSLMGVALLGATVFSTSASAALSGSVGVFSEYMWRGLPQTNGAAVQGSLNYAAESGLYAGTWVSNLGYGGAAWADGITPTGTEQDFYVGFASGMGAVKYDVGVVYEWVPEDGEVDQDWSTLEIYGKLGVGPVLVTYLYSPEQNFVLGDGQGESSSYLTGTFTQPISEKLSFVGTLSYFTGKEIERFLDAVGEPGDGYIDYLAGLTVAIDGGYTASFSYVGTDIEAPGSDPKVVVGLTKAFDL